MMEKDKLRKADIFSGGLIFLAGGFIVSQALNMPMKDSWGGVQNVWYVSPAIFPLFIGTMIMILGGLLVRAAIKEVGVDGIKSVSRFVFSSDFIRFLKFEENIRFYAVNCLLLSFVYLYLPRVDFFIASILFLMVFISIFYLDDAAVLKRLLLLYLVLTIVLTIFIFSGLIEYFSSFTDYPADILVLIFIPVFCVSGFSLSRKDPILAKKFKTSLMIAVIAPLLIGMIFKYLLLVPMPFEGLAIKLSDWLWYM